MGGTPHLELQFFISVNEGSEIECFYDGYDGVCSYIPQMGSDKVRPGNSISFGRAEAWDTDCSSGCDLYVRIVQNTGSDQVLIDELTESDRSGIESSKGRSIQSTAPRMQRTNMTGKMTNGGF